MRKFFLVALTLTLSLAAVTQKQPLSWYALCRKG